MAVFQTKPSQKPHKNFYAYYRKDLTRIRYKRRKPPAVTIYRENFAPKKFTGKEQDQETGLYYFGARYLDPKTSRWLSTDPALGDYLPVAPNNNEAKKHNQNLPGMGGVFNVVNLHVYHYAGNNPVKLVDPDGEEVEVTINEDGTYTVTGGTQNDDRNIYIMKDGKRTGEILGQTFTDNSFFLDNGNVVEGAIIYPNDNSGQNFINNEIISDNPGLIQYMSSGWKEGTHYDFKNRGGTGEKHKNRGMPIKDAEGNTVYASARDVGNYAAGYMAGRRGFSWGVTRFTLDLNETVSKGKRKWTPEGMPSQDAQRNGFDAGRNQLRSQKR